MQKIPVWLVLIGVVTLVLGTIYATIQQDLRQSANDPQIQLAEDTARMLDAGRDPSTLAAPPVEINQDLQPFIMIFDQTGKTLVSNAILGDHSPLLPDGLLAYVKAHGEHRLTWQPRPDTRIAAVIVTYKDGFVLAGRNLREVEARETRTMQIVAIAWALSLLGILLWAAPEIRRANVK